MPPSNKKKVVFDIDETIYSAECYHQYIKKSQLNLTEVEWYPYKNELGKASIINKDEISNILKSILKNGD